MQTTSDLVQQPVQQARSAAVTSTAVRLSYLDTIRVILISLVIALHTAIVYGALGDWTYVDPAGNELSAILLTIITTLVQAFSLGLYFFISGYFTPGSYDRKGITRFWKERLLRLALPMAVYTWVLSSLTQYYAALGYGKETTGSFWAFFRQNFLNGADEGPTWFIFALLLFTIGYTLWRWISASIDREKLAWIRHMDVPNKKQILGFGLVVALGMFIVGLKSPVGDTLEVFGIFNLMTIFFVQYILAYIAGTLAYRNDWLARFNGKDLRFWSWLTLGMILMMPALFVLGGGTDGPDVFTGGLHWQSAAFMVWIGLFSVSISMTLLLWLRDRKLPQSRLMAIAGPNSYGVYLIHPLILVPITVWMTPVPLSPLLKFGIVLPLVLLLCFLVSEGLRRIPGVKAVL